MEIGSNKFREHDANIQPPNSLNKVNHHNYISLFFLIFIDENFMNCNHRLLNNSQNE